MSTGFDGREGEWLDLVADLLSGPTTVWPDLQISMLLVGTLDSAAGIFHEQSGSGLLHRNEWPREQFAPYMEEQLHWSRYEALRQHPLLLYHLTTGRDDCLQVADVPSGIADSRLMAGWTDRGRRWGGVQSQISLPVRFGAAGVRSFVVARADRYTEQEMRLARRVRRLLVALDRQFDGFSAWSVSAGPEAADTSTALHLTPRELVVLDLLSRNLTAAAIARRLAIAERTVQKHLQRIYRKLGAVDRLDAVRRAEYLGLVQPPGHTQFPTLPPR